MMSVIIRRTIGILIFFLSTQSCEVSARRQHCPLAENPEEVYVYYKNAAEPIFTKNKEEAEQFGDENVLTTLEVKRCTCTSANTAVASVFAKEHCYNVNNVNMCSVNFDFWTNELGRTYCYKKSNFFSQFLNLLWMPSIFFLMIVIIMPCSTVVGKNATEYLFSSCIPYLRRRRIDRIIQNEIESISNYIDTSSSNRDDGMVEQIVLKLRTKSVEVDINPQFSSNDVCMICMGPFEDGEKIGDLSCGHCFHVECLKNWLRRKNACPLCEGQVADPHTVLVSREEAFADNDGNSIDEETRSRFDRLLAFYHRRTTRSLNS